MTDDQLIEIVEEEFRTKSLGVTQQYLEIHEPVYENNKLKIERIDRELTNGVVSVYLPVRDEKFYFVVWIDTDGPIINTIKTEASNRVYFRATSDDFTLNQLVAMTKLKPTDGWSKGDFRLNGKSKYKFSSIEFLPNPEPDEFEDKLKKLLDFLETDKDGIKLLVQNADGFIQVAMDIHNGNGMIGGHNIDSEDIRRMSNLGLSINFDLYVGGKTFKE